jgi:hypothetical protein
MLQSLRLIFGFWLVCLGLSSFASAQQTPILYAITTEFIDNNQETAVYSVIVDPITGKLTNVSENIVYAGGSGTYDGISAFNSATGIYYYVTDFDVIDYVYSTNVVKAQVLAPLDVYAKAVFRLAANPNNGLAYILFYSSQGSYVLLVSVDQYYAVKMVHQFPLSAYNFNYIAGTAVNTDTNTFYLIVSTKANVTDPQYKVVSIDPKTGSITATSPALNCPGFVEYFSYDPKTKKLIGVVLTIINNKVLQYNFAIVDPATGTCTASKLTKVTGIVTCSTFSAQNRILYVHEAINGGNLLHRIDPTSGNDLGYVQIQGYNVLESMEISG